MGLPPNEPLVQQAQALLARCADANPDPEQHNALLQLALACHSRMLELGDSHRPTAVALAITGADLLQALQRHTPTGSAVPDWVLVHEEQCCRYGAIWMHDLLQQQQPIPHTELQRSLALLQRLQQLHPEPIAWIKPMAAAFQAAIAAQESRSAAPDSTADLRLVIVGNCQAHPLMLGIRQAVPRLRIHACPSVHLATAEDVARLHQRLTDADLLVMHRVQPGYRDAIGLDSETLGQRLPASSRSVVLPNLHYEGHHPWIAYANDPEQRLAAIEAKSPLGPYHDFLAMAAARDGHPIAALLNETCSAELRARLIQEHKQSLHELKKREADCDVALSDWIDANHQQIPLAHTINHPTQASLDQLLRRLLRHLQLIHRLGPECFDTTEHLGALSIPIHPWVRQALELNAWASSWGQRQGHPLTIEAQLQESYKFYRDHPWIAEANSEHPKLKLAEALLKANQSQIPSQVTATARPTVAALINYYNDEDMLAWQLNSGCLDHYDRIYIWDGPYIYQKQLSLFSKEDIRLDATAIGQRLLADPRVIYCYRSWSDEATKRVDAYRTITEDLVVLHDTDEFFLLEPGDLQHFWQSPYAVASQYTQNLYAGGLLGSDAHHQGAGLKSLPRKRVLFRRQRISPQRHLDYCWLVGVQQQPADESLVQPEAIGHAYHLTACRSPRGQAAKMAFYMSLSLADKQQHPIVERLSALIAADRINTAEAQRVFLQGDPGYAGVPNPAFGLRLNERLNDPTFPQQHLEAMLAQVNRMAAGDYTLLSGYPLQLWFPADGQDLDLRLTLTAKAQWSVQSWEWPQGQPARRSCSLGCSSDALQLTLPHDPGVLGWLLTVTVNENGNAEALHQLNVARPR